MMIKYRDCVPTRCNNGMIIVDGYVAQSPLLPIRYPNSYLDNSGLYYIDCFGNIFSMFSKKFMPTYEHCGYKYLALGTQPRKRYYVHKLVMWTWNGGPPASMRNPTIDHIDGNRQNNYFSNLRWLENEENSSRQIHRARKYTDEQVHLACKQLVMTKATDFKGISERIGVSKGLLNRLMLGAYPQISCQYNLEKYLHNRTDPNLIKSIEYDLFVNNLSVFEICKKYGCYRHKVYAIKNRKLFGFGENSNEGK